MVVFPRLRWLEHPLCHDLSPRPWTRRCIVALGVRVIHSPTETVFVTVIGRLIVIWMVFPWAIGRLNSSRVTTKSVRVWYDICIEGISVWGLVSSITRAWARRSRGRWDWSVGHLYE